MRSRLLRHLRSLFRLQPGKPAFWLGVRAAAADELARLSRTAASAQQWEEASQRQARPLRIEIEEGRNSLAAARVGLGSEARRFEHLLVILEQGPRSPGSATTSTGCAGVTRG